MAFMRSLYLHCSKHVVDAPDADFMNQQNDDCANLLMPAETVIFVASALNGM